MAERDNSDGPQIKRLKVDPKLNPWLKIRHLKYAKVMQEPSAAQVIFSQCKGTQQENVCNSNSPLAKFSYHCAGTDSLLHEDNKEHAHPQFTGAESKKQSSR